MNGIDLNDVAAFVRVAEGGGFTAAAKVLGVPKSTVSRALTRLEGTLGVRLVQRTSRALALTDAGRAYYDRVRDAVAGVAEATADVVDLGAEPRGTIRITAPPDLGQLLIAGVTARFLEKYPQVRIEVSLTSRVVDLVAEGFDLAVRASPLADSSLVARKLGAADLGLFASRAYLKKRGTPATVADLASHDFVIFKPMQRAFVLRGPSGEETVTPHGPVESDDFLFVQRCVTEGVGVGLWPLFFTACEAKNEREGVRRVLPGWVVRGTSIAVVAPSARQEPRRVKLFREAILADARERGFGKTGE
jgi:DNA-binding transcriptional LysR family regulator